MTATRRGGRVAILLGALALGAPALRAQGCATIAPAGRTHAWEAPLDRLVSLRLPDLPLGDALDRLATSGGVPLAYSPSLVSTTRRVCVVAERQPLGLVLEVLLAGSGVAPEVVAGQVVLVPRAPSPVPPAARRESPSVLERFVVTGEGAAGARRASAVAVQVIDGALLRRQSLTALADILDAAGAGTWMWAPTPGSLVAQYAGVRGASSFGSSAPKIYLDGVEVANALVVTQLDPDAIDRVEIIRGPQGAALYGSDAIGGVVNVVARHDGGTGRGSRLSISSMAGLSASAYGAGLVPTHDQRLAVRAGNALRSAGLAVQFGQTGSALSATGSRQTSAVADARLVHGRAIWSGSARLFDRRGGAGENPLLATLHVANGPPASVTAYVDPDDGSAARATDVTRDLAEGARLAPATAPVAPEDNVRAVNVLPAGLAPPADTMGATSAMQALRQYTLGGQLDFATGERWAHNVLVGMDGYRSDNLAAAASGAPLSASAVAGSGAGARTTLRASSVARFGGDPAQPLTTLTLGVDQSVLRVEQAADIAGAVTAPAAPRWNHNTGLFTRVAAAWRDAVFVTAGLRVERNDAFTGTDPRPLLPMLGAAAVHELGPASLRLRAAYGRGIRPPATSAPSLDPESQAGTEVGAELSVGRAASLNVTRFDQLATALIQDVLVRERVRMSPAPGPRAVHHELQNVGEIGNHGWEVQGTLARAALSLSGAMTLVDSRVRAVARGYAGDLRAGDRMLGVPARTGRLALAWTARDWSAALSATRAMDWINYDRVALSRDHAIAGPPTGARLRAYWMEYQGDTHLRLSGSRTLRSGVELLVTGDNLLGGQVGEPDNATIRPGRTLTAGVRAAF